MTLEEKARNLQWTFYHGTGGDESELQFLERLLREWIEEEREACAKIADNYPLKEWEDQYKYEIARQIRARSS